MEYAIENEYLIVTVTTWGAQVKSVVRKFDDVEHMWQADKSVWGYHAPILFPHTGKVVDDLIETKGEVYQAKPRLCPADGAYAGAPDGRHHCDGTAQQ